ncbi:hypothetical protein SUGI_1348400 [Cryptomeria japonica]|uniref:Uncharacterized protein n=1 Tax=Cryptomeria japonica TaxID=3369 RepID=A0AAD3NRJ7_CRYJA|nr:hypothetical protein SUGI_1348400 [Cryptomeria japonica]
MGWVPRWAPGWVCTNPSQGRSRGGCRGGRQGAKVGARVGPKVSAKVGARVKVSANVGSKVPGSGAHPGQTERLGAPGQDRACTRGAPNMHQGALGPHVSAGRCARGGVWAPRCRRDTARTRRPVQVHARRPGRVHTRRPSKVRAPGQGSHLANGAHFAREGVHLDGGGWPGWIRTWVAVFAKYTLRQAHNGCDHTSVSAPDPIRTPQLSALGPE